MKRLWVSLLFFVALGWAQESVTIQLPWLNQFQFAGYYVAKEKGFYRDVGLDVTIVDARTKQEPFEAVMNGKAQYGVGRSSLIVNYISGAPIVLMAAVFQSSPMMLLTRKDADIRTVKELKNRRVMLTADTVEGAEFQAMFRSAGLKTSDVKLQEHSHDVQSLIRGETDAMVAYLSNEPYILQKRGIESHIIHPKEYGFDFYSDLLFTTKEETINHPQRAEAFYTASIRGWLWAFDHIEETADLISKYYNPQKKSLDALIYEGRVLKALAFKPNVAFGTVDSVRLEKIARWYRLMGVIPLVPSFEPLIYNHNILELSDKEKAWLTAHPVVRVGIDRYWPPIDYQWVWWIVGFMSVIFVLIAHKNRRLDTLVRQRTDELETFNQRLQEEIEKAVEKNRKQEKLLMQQAKMAEIGSMLESIAHQWRQPLNILGLSMARLNLNCALRGDAESSKVIEIAEAQIGYMSQTIDDFRNFFKQDRDQIMVNINTLINDVEALLGPLLVLKKIAIERNVDPTISVLVYPNEFKQVLINLVNNAREAIEQHRGHERIIRIRCTADDRYCTIGIEDTGGGIPMEIMDKIFDPYFTTKFESQGTGIGLYMAKMIIEKHFLGKLSVHNTPKGACFEIRLNRVMPQKYNAQSQNSETPLYSGN
ncbi:MAG: ABC transporter substrate-binding protein [Sulfuricurvum sp.]|nr:ABC transporter substrate-binding protein [Sulfuricurvum sp.]